VLREVLLKLGNHDLANLLRGTELVEERTGHIHISDVSGKDYPHDKYISIRHLVLKVSKEEAVDTILRSPELREKGLQHRFVREMVEEHEKHARIEEVLSGYERIDEPPPNVRFTKTLLEWRKGREYMRIRTTDDLEYLEYVFDDPFLDIAGTIYYKRKGAEGEKAETKKAVDEDEIESNEHS